MTATIHRYAGAIALVMIAGFWLSTAVSELLLGTAAVTAVKTAIPYGFVVLIPALIAAGASGAKLARGRRGGLVGKKLKRMPFIAGNGLVILIPSALFLASKAQAGSFDTAFYAVQVLELGAGAVNVALLVRNLRDGLRLTAARRRAKA